MIWFSPDFKSRNPKRIRMNHGIKIRVFFFFFFFFFSEVRILLTTNNDHQPT
ncbi:hypothetical protein Hanom_Chr00s011361g01747381 [Helianthus anomalus]